eukprot:scaffold22596_cov131-Cylindrotheca_fusiformis.AAC.26
MPGAPPGDNVGFYGSGVSGLRKTQVMSHEVFSFFVQLLFALSRQTTRSRSRSSERHELLLDVSEGIPVHTSNISVLHNKADNHCLGRILAGAVNDP